MLAITEQAAGTDTGLHRHANEDSYLMGPPVFVVADGMGGAQAGEVASQLAAEAFLGELGPGRPEQLLRDRIAGANAQIHRLAHSDPSLAGMGTTLTAAVLVGEEEEIVIGHVGDSRVYRLRQEKLEQLTRDHSLVEEMRRKGQITDEQAETHPQRSIITRALGPEPAVEADVQTVATLEDDVFLLCSDGLTTMVDDARIEALLLEAPDLESAVQSLIAEANRAGGRDNITALLFRVGAADGPPAADAATGATGLSRSPSATQSRTVVGASAKAEGLDGARIRSAARAQAAAGRPGRAGRLLGRLLRIAAALVLVGAVTFAGLWGARQVWFLSTDDGGRVALYQGLPYELPFGIELYSLRYSIPIQTESLPERRRESVTGHDLRSRDDAVSLINDILAAETPSAEPEPPNRAGPENRAGTRGNGGAQGQGGRQGQAGPQGQGAAQNRVGGAGGTGQRQGQAGADNRRQGQARR